MNAIKIITSAGLGLLMTLSCGYSEDPYNTVDTLTPVTISTTVSGLTKAGHPAGALTEGSIGLFFYSDGTDPGDGSYNATNREVTYASGSWVISGDALLWADDNTSARFYAYHPYSAALSSAELTVTVPTEQTAENILENDLLFSSPVTEKKSATGSIQLAMKHALSKFTIEVTYGSELGAGSSVTGITVDECATSGKFDLSVGSWVGGSNGNVTTIKMYKETDGYECILVPQSAKYKLTFVVSDNGVEKTFEYTPDAAQTFEAGVEYVLPVQLGGNVTKAGETRSTSWEELSGGNLTNK